MNHEMNTLAIGRQEAFSTMVSNKVPATAQRLSNGIHEAEETWEEQQRTEKAEDCGKEGKVKSNKIRCKHGDSMACRRFF